MASESLLEIAHTRVAFHSGTCLSIYASASMADDDVPEYDIDDMDSGMLEWLYVEDDYPLAVSHQASGCCSVPSSWYRRTQGQSELHLASSKDKH